MAWWFFWIGVIVLLGANSTSPGVWVGCVFIVCSAVIFAVRGDED